MGRPPKIDPGKIEYLKAKLSDKAWRMEHLYQILDKEKKIRPLVPNKCQREFLNGRHARNFLPKARKQGVSTIIVIDYFDDCVFARRDSPVHAAHIDYTLEKAFEKLDIALLAWNEGPRHPDPLIADIWRGIHARNPLVTKNKGELEWTNGSKQQAGTSFMGGTPSRLHWSEAGPMAYDFPVKANSIVKGTFPALPAQSIIDVETTMEGGTFGACADIFKLAEAMVNRPLTRLDWKLFFISWLDDPEYDLPGEVPEEPATKKYFDSIFASDGITVPLSRQAWYERTKRTQKNSMFTQYPTVIRECWYMGTGRQFFEAKGLIQMRNEIVPLQNSIDYGEIVISGDVHNFEQRSARWEKRDREVATVRMIERPIPGYSYLLFADCCVGKQAVGSDDDEENSKRDKHSYGILRALRIDPEIRLWHKPQIVAMCIPEDRCPTTEFIRRVVAMTIFYGDCMTVPEINNKDDIAPRLIAAGVRRMLAQGRVGADGAQAGTSKTEEVWGWHTSGGPNGVGGTRKPMLDYMEEETREHRWICTFEDVLQEMSTFVVNKKGRPEAAPGCHDDHVLGPGIGLFNLPAATKFVGKEEALVMEYQSVRWEYEEDLTGL